MVSGCTSTEVRPVKSDQPVLPTWSELKDKNHREIVRYLHKRGDPVVSEALRKQKLLEERVALLKAKPDMESLMEAGRIEAHIRALDDLVLREAASRLDWALNAETKK